MATITELPLPTKRKPEGALLIPESEARSLLALVEEGLGGDEIAMHGTLMSIKYSLNVALDGLERQRRTNDPADVLDT